MASDVNAPHDTTILQLAAFLLRDRISANELKGGPVLGEEEQFATWEDAIALAVWTSLYEVAWTSGSSGFDEEHQTASFFGHLASNLTWYSLLFAFSQDDPTELHVPQVFWSGHTKHPPEDKTSSAFTASEPQTGMDFGIISYLPSEKLYRIALFQAKRADSNNSFQLVFNQAKQMSLTQEKGHSESNSKNSWCHFAIWFHGQTTSTKWFPASIPLDIVLPWALNKRNKEKNKLKEEQKTCMIPKTNNFKQLSSIIIEVITGSEDTFFNQPKKYLSINEKCILNVIDQIIELMPGLTFTVVNAEGEGGIGVLQSCKNIEFRPQNAVSTMGKVVRRSHDFKAVPNPK